MESLGKPWPDDDRSDRSRTSVSVIILNSLVCSVAPLFFGKDLPCDLRRWFFAFFSAKVGTTTEEKLWKYDDQDGFFKKQPDKSCHSTQSKANEPKQIL